MTDAVTAVADFLFELDRLKLVERKTWVCGGVRRENSAEHSWQLAMACWAFASMTDRYLNMEKLLKLALVHDLGEIDGGDTFLYSADRHAAPDRERECIQRLSALRGNSIDDLHSHWEEQESGLSNEAKLLKVVDRLLPFMHNMRSEGKAWREHGILRSQVEQAHAFIADLEPGVHAWISENIALAVAKGWLQEDQGILPG